MEMTFTGVFIKVSESDGGGYTAYAEELPAAITQGDTMDEARENLRDAITLVLETNRAMHEEDLKGSVFIKEKVSVNAA